MTTCAHYAINVMRSTTNDLERLADQKYQKINLLSPVYRYITEQIERELTELKIIETELGNRDPKRKQANIPTGKTLSL